MGNNRESGSSAGHEAADAGIQFADDSADHEITQSDASANDNAMEEDDDLAMMERISLQQGGRQQSVGVAGKVAAESLEATEIARPVCNLSSHPMLVPLVCCSYNYITLLPCVGAVVVEGHRGKTGRAGCINNANGAEAGEADRRA